MSSRFSGAAKKSRTHPYEITPTDGTHGHRNGNHQRRLGTERRTRPSARSPPPRSAPPATANRGCGRVSAPPPRTHLWRERSAGVSCGATLAKSIRRHTGEPHVPASLSVGVRGQEDLAGSRPAPSGPCLGRTRRVLLRDSRGPLVFMPGTPSLLRVVLIWPPVRRNWFSMPY